MQSWRALLGILTTVILTVPLLSVAAEKQKSASQQVPAVAVLSLEHKAIAVAWSPDGRQLAIGAGYYNAPGEFLIWDWKENEKSFVWEEKVLGVSTVAFSPDGKHVAAGFYSRNVARIFEVESGFVESEMWGHESGITGLSWSPDGEVLATSSLDQHIKLWDPDRGRELQDLSGHTDIVFDVCYSHSGGRLVSGSGDRTARVWDAKTGNVLLELKGHSSAIPRVKFSPDDKWIATVSWDRTAKVWDAETGRELHTLRGHTRRAVGLGFSPNSKVLATSDPVVRLWDAASGEELATIAEHDAEVSCLAFSPDGRYLATASDDKSVRVWDLHANPRLKERL